MVDAIVDAMAFAMETRTHTNAQEATLTTLQIVLLVLAIPATLYQLLKLGQLNALINHYGGARVTVGWRICMLLALGIQVALVLALTGVIA